MNPYDLDHPDNGGSGVLVSKPGHIEITSGANRWQ